MSADLIDALRLCEQAQSKAYAELVRARARAVAHMSHWVVGQVVTLDFSGRNRKGVIEEVRYYRFNQFSGRDQICVEVRLCKKNGQLGAQKTRVIADLLTGESGYCNMRSVSESSTKERK